MADVTTEALQAVKSSLINFQSDIDGMSSRASSQVDEICSECSIKIRKTEKDVEDTEVMISSLISQIDDLDFKLKKANAERADLEEQIPVIQHNINETRDAIAALNHRISELKNQLANAESDEQKRAIQSAIDAAYKQLAGLQDQEYRLQTQLKEAEDRVAALGQIITKLKAQKASCEEELEYQKSRCYNLKNKLERLRSAYNRVESDLSAYLDAVRRFENSSAERTQRNTGALDYCISKIEQYESTLL